MLYFALNLDFCFETSWHNPKRRLLYISTADMPVQDNNPDVNQQPPTNPASPTHTSHIQPVSSIGNPSASNLEGQMAAIRLSDSASTGANISVELPNSQEITLEMLEARLEELERNSKPGTKDDLVGDMPLGGRVIARSYCKYVLP